MPALWVALQIFEKFPFFTINRPTLTTLHTILLLLGFNGESQLLRVSLAERLVRKNSCRNVGKALPIASISEPNLSQGHAGHHFRAIGAAV